jgi:transcriptional regulator with XRE-family HTH domain
MNRRGLRKQYALAYALGVSESTVTRWRNGEAMSIDSAIALGSALDMSLDWFLTGRGDIDQHKIYAYILSDADHNLLNSVHRAAPALKLRVKSALIELMDSMSGG